MGLEFDPLAWDNLEEARQDPPLRAAFIEALDTIEGGTPRSRETALRVHGGTAWAIEVRVPGRDDVYQVVWAAFDDGRVNVTHIGRTL